MAETISHTWQTVEQAAVTLNVSTRTVARRLANGSLESRVDENGRRLVLVQQIAAGGGEVGDSIDDDTPSAQESALYVPTDPATQATVVPSSQTVTMLTVLQSTVTAARDDAGRARRSAKWAWAGVAAMAVLLVAGAALVSSTLTRTTVTTGLLKEQLAETKSELRQAQTELMDTRTAADRATRDLASARQSIEKQRQSAGTPVATPATQPTLIDRVVSLFAE